MKKILTIVLLVLGAITAMEAQSKHDDWPTYAIENVCSFKVPTTMEVRLDESYQGRFVKAMHQSSLFEMMCDECDLFFQEAKIVLQPKGLNEDPFSDAFRNANSSYGRIILFFAYNDIFTQDEVKKLTPSELTVLDTMWRNEVKNELDCLGKFTVFDGSFNWYPLRKEYYSGIPSLVIEYDRPGADGETHVREYKFFYQGKFLRITTSYSKTQEAKYKDDFMAFMKLLRIETDPKAKPQKTPSQGLFVSDEYHISFTYDPNMFAEVKRQNKTSRCFFKMESAGGTTVLLSAWDMEGSTNGISIYDDEIVADMKRKDKALENVQKSCEKVKISGIEALMTTAINNVYGVKYYYTTYRVFYKDRMYTIDFHIPEVEYNKNKNAVNEIVKGLKFN